MRNRHHSRLIAKLRRQGVIFVDPDTCYLDATVTIGAGTVIQPCVVLCSGVKVGKNCSVGPFAYLRPGTVLHDCVKIGDFVEVKNAEIGENTKISHLSYVGDADVGRDVNIGCGTVTVNYNGNEKHRTTVCDGAFIGCNSNLVAPVTVGESAFTAAGSTVTEDVPAYALAVARAKQINKEDWVKRRK